MRGVPGCDGNKDQDPDKLVDRGPCDVAVDRGVC